MAHPIRSVHWRRIHWILALLFVLPWAVLSITGAGLGFSDEIDRALNPDLRNMPPEYGKPPLMLNQLVQRVKQQVVFNKIFAIYPAKTPFDTTRVDYLPKGSHQQLKQAFFNPITGKLKGERDWQMALPIWLAKWHVYLAQTQWMHWVLLMATLGLGGMVLTGGAILGHRVLQWATLSMHAQLGVGLSVIWLAIVLSAVWVGILAPSHKGFSARNEMSVLNHSKGYDLGQTGLDLTSLSKLPLPLPNETQVKQYGANICPTSQQIVQIQNLPMRKGVGVVCQSNADYGIWTQTRWWVRPIDGQTFQLKSLPPYERWSWALHSGSGLGLFGRILWVWGSLALVYMFWSGYRTWKKRK